MSNPDELTQLWQAARQAVPVPPDNSQALLRRAKASQRHTLYFQLGNIAVLLAVVVGLLAFFNYVAPVREGLSRVGVVLMIGGLLLRIGIESYSVRKSRRLNVARDARRATDDALRYYRFRQRVHGPVTFSIVALYTLGFALLNPEFSLYFSGYALMAMDVFYLLGAVFLVWQIRKGIRKEMSALADLVAVQQEMQREESDS